MTLIADRCTHTKTALLEELVEVRDVDSSKKRSFETMTSINHIRSPSGTLRAVSSLPNLRDLKTVQDFKEIPIKKSCSAHCLSLEVTDNDSADPQRILISILQNQGYKAEIRKSSDLEDFFTKMTDESTAAYDQDVITAIREGDIKTLRKMHKDGRPLQCSNKFGESLIHMACRRGLTGVVRFLIKEAGVTLRVKDDVGRSPLHDAFWSTEPNYDLVDLLIEHDADLLLVKDNRGHLPFQYARHNQWKGWCDYLLSRREVICLNTFIEAISNYEIIG